MKIGELAERAEVNLQTLRYYEREKLLREPPRLSSVHQAGAGRRVYAGGDTRTALAGHQPKAREDRSAGARTGADIDNKILPLKAMKTALQHLTERCSGYGPSSECFLASIDSEEVLR